MQMIISGVNRVEFCKIKRGDLDKRFFLTRGELYFLPTNGMRRMRIYDFGKERESDEVIMYEENAIVPVDPCGLDYNMDNLLADIDRYKLLTDYSWFKANKPWITEAVSKVWALATSTGGIVLIVLLWVLLSGGFK